MVRNGRIVGVLVGLVGLVGAPLMAVVLMSNPAAAATATITVDNSGDGAGTPANCAPVPVAGQCTLRDGVEAAQSGADAGDDVVIDIPASVGSITLNSGGLQYAGGTSGTQALTLNGNGNTVDQTTNGNPVLLVTSASLLTVNGLTITGGNVIAGGGGIDHITGPTVVTNSTISGNTTTGNSENGGGIDAQGQLVTITDSTISRNNATPGMLSGGDGGGNLCRAGDSHRLDDREQHRRVQWRWH